MQDDDEAFRAFERGVRARPVLDVERERVTLGYLADVALQMHGADIEDEILRILEHESEMAREVRKSAEILSFVPAKKPDGA
jgi:hypothetical protein